MAERLRLDGPAHPGEQAVQAAAGEGGAGWGSPMFDGHVPPAFAAFMAAQPVGFLSAADDAGEVWTTMLVGGSGFVTTAADDSLHLAALPGPDDALAGALGTARDVGLTFIDFERRRRIRVNGTAVADETGLTMRTTQVLGNCPKYLHPRRPTAARAPAPAPRAAVSVGPNRRERLTADEQTWIADADTFLIGSLAAGHGADCSHRGGEPGFVRADETTVRWPDFLGNSFYMTFGNLMLDERCGLLFVDWARGHLLQLTGSGRIVWDHGDPSVPRPRSLVVSVRGVVRAQGDPRLTWVPNP